VHRPDKNARRLLRSIARASLPCWLRFHTEGMPRCRREENVRYYKLRDALERYARQGAEFTIVSQQPF
jgi:hypothetical protein